MSGWYESIPKTEQKFSYFNPKAPEVILGEPYDTRADVFSFGCILFELITRQKPVKRAPGNKFAVDANFFRQCTPKECPPRLLEICLACTQWDSAARPPMKDVLEQLKVSYSSQLSLPFAYIANVRRSEKEKGKRGERRKGKRKKEKDEER